MVFEPNEKIRKKMVKDGSVLKFMYCLGGMGRGLVAGGAMLAFAGAAVGLMMLPSFEASAALMAGAFGVVPGVLLIVGGAALQKRRDEGWLKAYVKTSHLPEQEILRADEELKGQGTLLFAFSSGKDTNSLKKMGFVTPHYIRFPGMNAPVARLEDLVACFYTKKFLCKDGGYDKAFVAYTRDKNMAYLGSDMSEKAALEVIAAVSSRNPAVITDHHFMYQGKQYDAAQEMDEVIALYNSVTGAGES